MAHFSATLAVAGYDDLIRFGSLEFPALPPIGMWVPPVFEPSQAFLFESLDFVTDRLGVLCLHEEATIPAPIGGVPSINSRMHDFNDAASALYSKQTLCSNPIVSNMRTVIYSLSTISHRSSGGTVLPAPRTPYDRFPYGLVSPADTYARGLQRILALPPLTSKFMGMVSYAPTTFHELLDDEVESDGSSIDDLAPSHCPSRECTMADALGQPPVVAESLQTHTPPDPCVGALTLAQEHGEELRQWR